METECITNSMSLREHKLLQEGVGLTVWKWFWEKQRCYPYFPNVKLLGSRKMSSFYLRELQVSINLRLVKPGDVEQNLKSHGVNDGPVMPEAQKRERGIVETRKSLRDRSARECKQPEGFNFGQEPRETGMYVLVVVI